MTYIPMTKSSMCRYSYKKIVDISKHFDDNRSQQNNTPVLQQPNASMRLYFNKPKLLRVDTSTDQSSCVDIPTDQSSYVSIFLQKLPVISTNQSSYVSIFLQKLPAISTNQSSYVSIFLQTKAPMCRYSYRNFPLFLRTKAPMLRYFNSFSVS
jgi:hypothetical protein